MDAQDPQVAWLVRDIRAQMRKRPKRHQLSDAAIYAFRLYEANTANLPSGELACKAGCGGCCSSQVGVEMAEAFAIVRHLQESLETADFETVLMRVQAMADDVGALDAGARWSVQKPCAFLDTATQMCTIYEARPVACRGYNSVDLEACETSTQTLDHNHPIPADGERMMRARQLRHALEEVTNRLIGKVQDDSNVELHVAVATASKTNELAWLKSMKKG